jgi:hypothetical protein
MSKYTAIYDIARLRMGGDKVMDSAQVKPQSRSQLGTIPDVNYQSARCIKIFPSDLVWRVVDNRMANLEDLFQGSTLTNQ